MMVIRSVFVRKRLLVHGSILEIGLRIALLRVDEYREFGGFAQEENRCIVEDPVPITLFSVELDGKASRISS